MSPTKAGSIALRTCRAAQSLPQTLALKSPPPQKTMSDPYIIYKKFCERLDIPPMSQQDWEWWRNINYIPMPAGVVPSQCKKKD
jgi:hypothetical protein